MDIISLARPTNGWVWALEVRGWGWGWAWGLPDSFACSTRLLHGGFIRSSGNKQQYFIFQVAVEICYLTIIITTTAHLQQLVGNYAL